MPARGGAATSETNEDPFTPEPSEVAARRASRKKALRTLNGRGIVRTFITSTMSVAALAAATALVFGVPGAGATQGQPVLAGSQNTATLETLIVNTNKTGVSLNDCLDTNPFLDSGLVGCGFYGLDGLGFAAGVRGKGPIGSGGTDPEPVKVSTG